MRRPYPSPEIRAGRIIRLKRGLIMFKLSWNWQDAILSRLASWQFGACAVLDNFRQVSNLMLDMAHTCRPVTLIQ